MIPVNRPVITEADRESVQVALEETWISGETPPVREMEDSLRVILGVKDVIALSTGTTALDLAVEALDVKPGDECIVPSFTIISSVSNLLRRGASLTLIDSDPQTWSMDAVSASNSLSKRTKLVLPVHIYGLPVQMELVMKCAEDNDVFVLEDAAEALGVTYKGQACGAIGNAGIFSFYANKIVTGGEGGAVATNNMEFGKRIRYFRNLCFNPEKRFVHSDLGWNARMPGLSAALITSQLRRLPILLETKIDIGKRYREGLYGHPWFLFQPSQIPGAKNAYWVFGVLLNSASPYGAAKLQEELKKLDIETRRFFCPLHLQPFKYQNQLRKTGNLSVSENLWERGLYLPSGLGTTSTEIDRVIEVLWKLAKK